MAGTFTLRFSKIHLFTITIAILLLFIIFFVFIFFFYEQLLSPFFITVYHLPVALAIYH